MSLPGCATALAVSANKRRIAYDSGVSVVELVRKNIPARRIMTLNAFKNAIVVDMALGGSSNTILHLPAIANEAGIELPLELFDKISRTTPHITLLEPAGDHFMEDLDRAGGIGAVLSALKTRLVPSITVGGGNIIEIAKQGVILTSHTTRRAG